MTEFTRREQEAFLRWSCGNKHAAALMDNLAYISQIADDFADGDVPVEQRSERMHQLLLNALVRVPENPFFQAYREWLVPVMGSAIHYWEASNSWARSERRETRMYAFVYRDCLQQVLTIIAGLCGGADHARQVTLEMHEFWQVGHGQAFEEWEAEEAERAAPALAIVKEAASG